MSLRVASFVSNVIMEYFPAKGKEITREPVCHPLTAGFLAMILELTRFLCYSSQFFLFLQIFIKV